MREPRLSYQCGKCESENMSESEAIQNGRIRDLESRVNQVENDLSSILAKLETLTTIGKGLAMLAALALGVDIAPMVGV